MLGRTSVVLGPLLLALLPCGPARAACVLPSEGSAFRLLTIVPGAVYRVWSNVEKWDPVGQEWLPFNDSAIYVFKGTQIGANTWRVYLFGSGYGDKDSDMEEYTNDTQRATRSAVLDAADVAHVITDAECFGLQDKTVKIRALVPHGHLDHTNAEFINQLLLQDSNFELHEITHHAREETLVTCEAKCCEGVDGVEQCTQGCNPSCQWRGAPYLEAWGDLEPFIAPIGDDPEPDETCTDIETYDITAAPGTLRVELEDSDGHTPGSLNLVIDPETEEDRGILFDGSTPGCFLLVYQDLNYRHFKQHSGGQGDCPD